MTCACSSANASTHSGRAAVDKSSHFLGGRGRNARPTPSRPTSNELRNFVGTRPQSRKMKAFLAVAAFAILFWPRAAFAQSLSEDVPPRVVARAPTLPAQTDSLLPPELDSDQEQRSTASADTTPLPSSSAGNTTEGKQSKRILWIFPNYRAVSANTQLPPLSVKEKFWLATKDSFDYSSFVTAGIIAGFGQARNSTPEFGQGAKGYGRYYWHAVADQAVGNYFTEAIMPAIMREDPRYYTLGNGSFLKRTGYALSRLVVTRTNSGGRSFNFSEIVGNGAGAGVSNLYYPSGERTWTKTGQKWVEQIGLDGAFNILKEFWPDINQRVFHGKY